jgi:hypothetical protein
MQHRIAAHHPGAPASRMQAWVKPRRRQCFRADAELGLQFTRRRLKNLVQPRLSEVEALHGAISLDPAVCGGALTGG